MIETFHDDLPEDSHPSCGGRWFRVIDNLLDEPDASWWDDANTDEVEGRADILVRVLEVAIEEIGGDTERRD